MDFVLGYPDPPKAAAVDPSAKNTTITTTQPPPTLPTPSGIYRVACERRFSDAFFPVKGAQPVTTTNDNVMQRKRSAETLYMVVAMSGRAETLQEFAQVRQTSTRYTVYVTQLAMIAVLLCMQSMRISLYGLRVEVLILVCKQADADSKS